MALLMKEACERCGLGLSVDGEAYICSYECTFCRGCTLDMNERCPNCGGELVARPRRQTPPSAA
ncbi:MAG: DUF1272 domain-containing protein [Kiloniellales bacterium]